MELTRTDAVFSRIALVSYFCAEIKVLEKSRKIPEIIFLQKTHGARRGLRGPATAPRRHLAAAQGWPRLGPTWPGGGSAGDALSPIYFLKHKNARTPDRFSIKDTERHRHLET